MSASAPAKAPPTVPQVIVRVLGSYGLAVVLLAFLFMLTLFGTLEQRSSSLYDVQTKYFESAFLVHYVGGKFPIVLPGAYLLLTLLLVNLVTGGILRMRRGKTTLGILVTHIGIVVLLLGSFVEHSFSTKGFVRLTEPERFRDTNANGTWDPGEPFEDANRNGSWDEGESGRKYQSYQEWEVVVSEPIAGGKVREYVVPQERFDDLESGEVARFVSPDLPFELQIDGYQRNCEPVAQRSGGADGFALRVLDPVTDSDQTNVPGVFVTLVPKAGERTRALLWGVQKYPFQTEVAGRLFDVDLRRRQWDVPFSIRLDDFVVRYHPGTGMASEYSSYVTKLESGVVQRVHITMNEPLRHEGYTFYQSSWGPQGSSPDARLFSVFAVVNNPSDRVPLIACIIIALGLLYHFGLKLFRHVRAEARKAAA